MIETHVSRLITAKDLNHHGTLFAGQTAKWMIEACFVSAAKLNGRTDDILCVNIEGLTFKRPVNNGDVIDIITFPVFVGRSSLTIVGRIYSVYNENEIILETAVTFVIVDEDGNPTPHGITFDKPTDPEKLAYWERLSNKRKKRKN